MDDNTVLERIDKLVEEEKKLLSDAEGQGPDAARDKRLDEVKVALDRAWDLLRQRRAREEFDQDPDRVSERDADTVEGYQQ